MKTNVSRKGPVAKGGRSGGEEAASVLTYAPESLIAPDSYQTPTSGRGTNLQGWAEIITADGASAVAGHCDTDASEAANATAAAIDLALTIHSPWDD